MSKEYVLVYHKGTRDPYALFSSMHLAETYIEYKCVCEMLEKTEFRTKKIIVDKVEDSLDINALSHMMLF